MKINRQSGPGCSKVGYHNPPDKSLFRGGSIREINSTIHWIENYLVDSTIQLTLTLTLTKGWEDIKGLFIVGSALSVSS